MGLMDLLGKVGGLFGGGGGAAAGTAGTAANSGFGAAVGGVGDLSGGGGGDPMALGKMFAPLGNIQGGNNSGEKGIMNMLNQQKLGMTNFLAQGGGGDNARDMLNSGRENIWHNKLDTLLTAANPSHGAALEASEGRGPGGGFGVTSGVQDFLKQNDPGLEFIKDVPMWKKIAGAAAQVAGGAFAPVTGGLSAIGGNLANSALTSGDGGKETYKI